MSKTEFGMLAHTWSGSFEQIEGWLASRKYNGWSALWDGGLTRNMVATEVPWYYKGGDKGTVYSTGLWSLGRDNKPKVIHAPDYFLNKLPKRIPLHGELWYNDRLDIVKRVCGTKKIAVPMWMNIKYKVFNAKYYSLWDGFYTLMNRPEFQGFAYPSLLHLPLIDLLGVLNQYENDTVEVIKPIIIHNEDILKQVQAKAVLEGWEGLMFANPDSTYECSRSWNNLKWKQEYETEGAVYDYEEGKTGKNVGKVGAIKCTLVWDEKILSIYGGNASMVGREVNFAVCGLTDEEREWVTCTAKYPVGSKLKFSYKGVSIHGVPQSCNIYRGK